MTPAEFHTLMEAKVHEKEMDTKEYQAFLDTLNGKFCAVYASFHGVESRPLDYMITTKEEKMTEELIEQNFEASWRVGRYG
jgi:hypothetical protein